MQIAGCVIQSEFEPVNNIIILVIYYIFSRYGLPDGMLKPELHEASFFHDVPFMYPYA